MQTFAHNFKSNPENVNAISGYTKALNDVFQYLLRDTLRGEKKYIEALPLVELIEATNEDLMRIMKEIQLTLTTETV